MDGSSTEAESIRQAGGLPTATAERSVVPGRPGSRRGRGTGLRDLDAVPRLMTAAPAALFFLVLLVVPLAILALYSVLTSGLFDVSRPFTFGNYRAAVANSVTASLATNSVVYGAVTATVTVAVAIPVAVWLRFATGVIKNIALFIITASVFASYLVRIYAWRTILGDNGVVNTLLKDTGIAHHPIHLLYDRFAVVVALVHIFLPYVILMVYAALAPVRLDYLEAAADLGANARRRWTGVILPIVAAPAIGSFVFVFVRSAGDYVTPQFLGATSGSTLGVLAKDQFTVVGNWGYGAAISLLMLAAFACASAIMSFPLRLVGLNNLRFER